MRRVRGVQERRSGVDEMRLAEVRPGKIFATDVVGANGLLLVARGQEVTPSLLERVRSSWRDFAAITRVSTVA